MRFCAAEPVGTIEAADVGLPRGEKARVSRSTLGNFRPGVVPSAAARRQTLKRLSFCESGAAVVPVFLALKSPYHSPRAEVSAATAVPGRHRRRHRRCTVGPESLPEPVPLLAAVPSPSTVAVAPRDRNCGRALAEPPEGLARHRRPSAPRQRTRRAAGAGRRTCAGDLPPRTVRALSRILPSIPSPSSCPSSPPRG